MPRGRRVLRGEWVAAAVPAGTPAPAAPLPRTDPSIEMISCSATCSATATGSTSAAAASRSALPTTKRTRTPRGHQPLAACLGF